MTYCANIIEKSGTWFSYKDQRIGQGRETAKKFLADNPKISDEIEKAIRANMGKISEAMIGSPESDPEETIPPTE